MGVEVVVAYFEVNYPAIRVTAEFPVEIALRQPARCSLITAFLT
jgi:hypothetical protein